jgi:hypothetical protein
MSQLNGSEMVLVYINNLYSFNWVFYGVSIEKKNPRRQSPQGKLLFFLFFFKHLTEIITGMFL